MGMIGMGHLPQADAVRQMAITTDRLAQHVRPVVLTYDVSNLRRFVEKSRVVVATKFAVMWGELRIFVRGRMR